MENKRSKKYVCVAVFALLLFVVGLFGGRQVLPAFAEEEKVYTNVLADLQEDEQFSIINYPESEPSEQNPCPVDVIQIAESVGGELYLYTYQPCEKTMPVIATEINMSLSESVNGTSLFPLELLNTNGVFCKYLVGGVVVSSDTVRYYNISSIYRDWNTEIDGESDNDNIKNAKAFAVGKLYRVETKDGAVVYDCQEQSVISILNPYADHLRYNDGLHWDFLFATHNTDVHYIAFDTDFPIDMLQEADISYYTQPYTWKTGKGYTYGDKSDLQYIPITGEQTGENAADGFSGIKYKWKRIQSSADFKKTVSLSDEAAKEVDKTKWVLLFLETSLKETQIDTFGGREITRTGTKVSEATILRLKFVTVGKVYNLGAVSDKVTADDIPGGGAQAMSLLDMLCKWLEQVTGVPALVWKIIICALPFFIVLPILSAFFPVIGQILLAILKGVGMAFVWLCKGIVWLICLPFRGIAALVRKIRGT